MHIGKYVIERFGWSTNSWHSNLSITHTLAGMCGRKARYCFTLRSFATTTLSLHSFRKCNAAELCKGFTAKSLNSKRNVLNGHAARRCAKTAQALKCGLHPNTGNAKNRCKSNGYATRRRSH